MARQAHGMWPGSACLKTRTAVGMKKLVQSISRSWFDLPLMSKGIIVISIPLICILVSVAAISVLQRQRQYLDEWIGRAFNAGAGVQAVITLLTDAESGTRGYLLTQDQTYLDAVRKAQAGMPHALARLRTHVGDQPSQQERLDHLDALTNRRLAAMANLLAPSDAKGSLSDRLNEGRALSAAINAELDAMRTEETRRWLIRIIAERRLRQRLSALMYGGAIVSLLGGGLAMAMFVLGIVRRAAALRRNADRLASGQALTELGGGADEIGRVAEALVGSSQLLAQRDSDLRQLTEELESRVRERTAQLERETAQRRKSEEHLRHAQKMEAIGRLAGGIAHDFNNVLAIVIGFGQCLAERLDADPAAREDLGEILQAAQHATTLTRQLLTFSRRQVVQPQLLNPNEIILRTEKLLRRVIGEDITFQTSCTTAPATVLMDEGQLEQVIMNLVLNARDAMPTGGTLTVATVVVDLVEESYCDTAVIDMSPGRYVMVTVRDSGHGMTPEIQARIFEPFFTTKGANKGTGLGLATVYGIVKQSGGSIWVYSEPGIGSTFKVYLPVAEATTERRTPDPAAVPTAAGILTILLVEDEPGVRRMARQVLTRFGHTVLEADGADAALRVCREHNGPIALLLTDVIMPKTNGWELAQLLRRSYPDLKVLYMSGYADDIVSKHAILEPGVGFIEKPFTPTAIANKIRELTVSR
jgi:signal transduction histidine kinase